MKKLTLIFLLSSLLKAVLLYFFILIGDIVPSIHILLRFLFYFLIIAFVDRKTIRIISPLLNKGNWIKFTFFTFGSSFLVLWITGPLFLLHNFIFRINTDELDVSSPLVGMIIFWLITLIISSIASYSWVLYNNHRAPIR